MSELGIVTMLAYDHAFTLKPGNYEKLPRIEKHKVIAHQMHNMENNDF